MSTIRTADIIPVDLNSVLCAVELALSYLIKEVVSDPLMALRLHQNAMKRYTAINEVLWSEEKGMWSDYFIKEKKLNPNFYASDIFPLWIEHFDWNLQLNSRRDEVHEALDKLRVLSYKGGFPTSKINSGQQWDFPNGWAPLQHIAVHSLDNNASKSHLKESGRKIAQNFLENAYLAWVKTGHMFEKYNVETKGKAGHGGEYVIQTGFGWTNGVILDFLHKYGDVLESPESSSNSGSYFLSPILMQSPPSIGRLPLVLFGASYLFIVSFFVWL